MKNKEILNALKELNLNNHGCEPTVKLTTKMATLKALNQYNLFYPFGAVDSFISFSVGCHPRLLIFSYFVA